jgi:hypothetical protein
MKEIVMVATLALWCAACNGTSTGTSFVVATPTAPTVTVPQIPGVSLMPILVGDVVNGTIVPTDLQCGDYTPEIAPGPCQGFETVAPADGRLTIQVTSQSQHHLALLVRYPGGGETAGDGQSSVTIRTRQVKAGTSIVIGVWGDTSEAPARVAFQLTTTLAP